MGMNIGNQLNIPGVKVAGLIPKSIDLGYKNQIELAVLMWTSSYNCASKKPANP
jgi:hypothetical protein